MIKIIHILIQKIRKFMQFPNKGTDINTFRTNMGGIIEKSNIDSDEKEKMKTFLGTYDPNKLE